MVGKMEFQVEDSLKILEQTPATLTSLLKDLPGKFITQNEGGDSWSPNDVVGHLVHGEEADWINRVKFILEYGTSQPFQHANPSAQFEQIQKKPLSELLDLFANLRQKNLAALKQLNLSSEQLQIKGAHPAFKEVSISQVLSAWVVHDLNHIYQIARVIARQYHQEVGPFKPYISILNR